MLDTITAPTPPRAAADTASTARALRALQVANTRRTAVAELKARLRRGELTLADVVLDPPGELHGYQARLSCPSRIARAFRDRSLGRP